MRRPDNRVGNRESEPGALTTVFLNGTKLWRGCVSFDLVSPEEWGSKTGKWACDRETLEQRARETRRWPREKMRQLGLSVSHATTSNGKDLPPRSDCVLVTHGGFLHLLTEDWEGFDVKAGELAYAQTSALLSTLLRGLSADTVTW